MIKQAKTIADFQQVITLLKDFLSETAYSSSYDLSVSDQHLGKMAAAMSKSGYIWLAYNEQQPVGLLIAVRESNMWAPALTQLREIVWYVRPEHRKTSLGGRLFLEYCRCGDELIEQKKIQGYFTTKMTSTDDIDLERRGFRLTERTYLKEY